MKFVLASATCFAIASVLSVIAFNQCAEVLSLKTACIISISGFAAAVSLLLGVTFFFISTQPVSSYTNLGGGLLHTLILINEIIHGRRAVADFEAKCKQPREAQEDSLRYVLKRMKGTAIFRDKGLAEVKTLNDLRRRVSLTTYEDYVNYVNRMAKGEENVMVTGVPERLVLTSGTTGMGKLFPCKSHSEIVMLSSKLQKGVDMRCFPGVSAMRPMLFFYCLPKLTKTECGIDVGPITYLSETQRRRVFVTTVTPYDGYGITTIPEALYIHLLFGLRDKDVGTITTVFTTTIVEAMQLLEKKWQQLVEDIEVGNIDPALKLTSDLRQSLTKSLDGGNKDRANELRREFEKGFDGIVKRVWPSVEFITAVDVQHLKGILVKTYFRGITIHSHTFSGSEGTYGFNMDPFSVTPEYTLALYSNCVIEFIPEEDIGASDPTTCFADEVEVGKKYEIVITNQYTGLCRYRLGDVVEITGLCYKCPKMRFSYRSGSLLNMCSEKLSSDIVRGAVEDAFKSNYPDVNISFQVVAESGLILGAEIVGLTESKNAHYIFFIEVECTNSLTEIDTAIIAESIDANLCERHLFFRYNKNSKKIQSSSVYIVHPGSFNKLKDYIILNSSASANQFKMPEKLRTVGMFETLYSCRI